MTAPCLVVTSNMNTNDGRTRRRQWRGRERRRQSTGVLWLFCGNKGLCVRGEAGSCVRKDCVLGEKLALVCVEICTTHADVWSWPVTLSLCGSGCRRGWGLPAKDWHSRGAWRLTIFGRESLLFAESLGGLWRPWTYSLFCCRALKVDGRWNKFIFWLFLSSTKPAFYLCLHELTHLHSHTVLSLSFFFYFFLKYPPIASPESNTVLSLFRHRGVVILVPCAGWWECQRSRGKGRDGLDQGFKPRLKPLSLQVLSAGCWVIKMSYLN